MYLLFKKPLKVSGKICVINHNKSEKKYLSIKFTEAKLEVIPEGGNKQNTLERNRRQQKQILNPGGSCR